MSFSATIITTYTFIILNVIVLALTLSDESFDDDYYEDDLEIFTNISSTTETPKKTNPESISQHFYTIIDGVRNASETETTKVHLLSQLFGFLFLNKRICDVVSMENVTDPVHDVVLRGFHRRGTNSICVDYFMERKREKGQRSTSTNIIIIAETFAEVISHMDNIGKTLQGDEYGQDMFIIIIPELSVVKIVEIAEQAWHKYHWFNVIILFFKNIIDRINLVVNMFNPYSKDNVKYFIPTVQKFVFNNESKNIDFKQPSIYLSGRVKNLKGYQLTVTMDSYRWFSFPVYDSFGNIKRFSGNEGEVVHLYSQKLNYTPLYKMPLDGTTYGGALNNGTIIGGVKDVNDENSDLYGNGIIVSSLGDVKVRTLRQIQQSKIVILLPLPEVKIQYIKTLLYSFDNIVIYFMLLVYVIMFVLWYLSKWTLDNRMVDKSIIDLSGETLTDIVAVLNSIAIKFTSRTAHRFVFFLLLYWSLIINSIYQGGIISGLTVMERENFDSLKDLATKSNYTITCVPDLCKFLEPSEYTQTNLDVRATLYSRVKILRVPELQSHIMAKYRNFSKIMPYFTALALQLINYDKYGKDLLHILDESLGDTYMTQVVPKWSPISSSLNKAQIQIASAGIGFYWKKYFIHKFRLKRYHTEVKIFEHPAIKVINLTSVFTLWIVGLIISLFVFTLEVISKWSIIKYKIYFAPLMTNRY